VPTPRVEALIVKLDRGGRKTLQALGALAPEGWSGVVYREPHTWDVRDLLAHLLSAEQGLLRVAQDVAAGGAGARLGAGPGRASTAASAMPSAAAAAARLPKPARTSMSAS